jgi:hypothetical protein
MAILYLYHPNMNHVIAYFKRHGKFFLFLFIFSWIFTLKNKLGFASSWDDFVFHPDAPYWVFLNSLLIFILVDFLKRRIDKKTTSARFTNWAYLKNFGLGYIFYLLLKLAFGLIVAFLFDTFDRNFSSSHQITYRIFDQSIDFFIFGGFSFAYSYWVDSNNYKKQLNAYQLLEAKSKISQLQEQLNPHFLFNNLNILDQLISEDQQLASDYLASFSELYRITLHNVHKDLIPIHEELAFVRHYFKMMATKYKGYELIVTPEVEASNLIIPPYCLQVLIENAFTHNIATEERPVRIHIKMDQSLVVSNNKVSPERKKKTNGIALNNLNEQFQLLIQEPLQIEDTAACFTVKLPFIKTNAHD